jgi:hypothetical protein
MKDQRNRHFGPIKGLGLEVEEAAGGRVRFVIVQRHALPPHDVVERVTLHDYAEVELLRTFLLIPVNFFAGADGGAPARAVQDMTGEGAA